MSKLTVFRLLAAVLCATATLHAQTPATSESVAQSDKSGTDPTKFLRTVTLKSEFVQLPSEDFVDTTSLVYIHPFADGVMNLRLKTPLVATDVAGTGEAGLGDLSLRFNWLADVNAQRGILVGVDSSFDTASESYMGRDTNVISPLVTYAWFVNRDIIFAPTYQHNVGIGGGPDVNESVIDLYVVFTAEDKKSWITVDPTITVNWENDQALAAVVEVQFGRNLGTIAGGALNGYIAPSIGIGDDRPIEWGVEIGVSLVGF